MKLKSLALFLLLSLSFGANARIIVRSYQLKGKAYNKNHELIRNGKLMVNQRGNEYEVLTDSLGNYSFQIFDYTANRGKGKRTPWRVKIRYEKKTISVRNKSKKYRRKQIYSEEKDLQF